MCTGLEIPAIIAAAASVAKVGYDIANAPEVPEKIDLAGQADANRANAITAAGRESQKRRQALRSSGILKRETGILNAAPQQSAGTGGTLSA